MTARAILEFGKRGERFSSVTLPLGKAARLAGKMIYVYSGAAETPMHVSRSVPRQAWQSSEWFVSVLYVANQRGMKQ